MESHIDIITNLLFPSLSNTDINVANLKSFSQINNIIEKIEFNLINFRENLKSDLNISYSTLETDLIEILGIGDGSTPVSDDFVIGVLSAIYKTDPRALEKYPFLSKFPFQKYTTVKSALLIRKVLLQDLPTEINLFVDLLRKPFESKNKISQFEREINKIKSIGASSGKVFLLGVLWELKFTLNSI